MESPEQELTVMDWLLLHSALGIAAERAVMLKDDDLMKQFFKLSMKITLLEEKYK